MRWDSQSKTLDSMIRLISHISIQWLRKTLQYTSCIQRSLSINNVIYNHRLKKGPEGKKDIIVRFQSRLLRNNVLREGRTLRKSGIFTREDLTPLNLEVFMSVKRKMTDEVSSVWTRNGAIFYKNVHEQVTRVDFEDYQTWLDLPWPKRPTK